VRVNVQGTKSGEGYLLECSACGPIGVSSTDEARDDIVAHLRNHGVQQIHQGESDD
jgi:hypothetical protein